MELEHLSGVGLPMVGRGLAPSTEALAHAMWRPLMAQEEEVSIVAFNMLLKGRPRVGRSGF